MDDGYEIFDYPDFEVKDEAENKNKNCYEIIKLIIWICVLIVCAINMVFSVKIYLLYTDYNKINPIIMTDSNLGVANKNNYIVDMPTGTVVIDQSNSAVTEKYTNIVTSPNQSTNTSSGSEITTASTTAIHSTIAPEENNGKININTASLDELMELKGIGEKKAQAIIDYRYKNGRFNSIEEITDISGIGVKTFENIRDEITVE